MAGPRKGIRSSASDNFLEPLNVTGLTATDVGTSRPYSATFNGTAGQGGAVSLSWTLPAASPPATSYDVTATKVSGPGSAAGTTVTVNNGSTSTSYTFEGLESAGVYTFTIIPKNASGSAKPTNTISGNVTVTTVPQAPQSPSATAGVDQNTVSWTIGANGGKALTRHNVTGTDGTSSGNLSASATSVVISDPSLGSQSYSITATNDNGTSSAATTSTITTIAPFFPFFPPFFPFFPPFFPFFPPFFPFFPFFPPFFPFFPPFFPFFPPFFPFFDPSKFR